MQGQIPDFVAQVHAAGTLIAIALAVAAVALTIENWPTAPNRRR